MEQANSCTLSNVMLSEWYVPRFLAKNGHHEGSCCYNEIGLHAENVLIVLVITFHICDHLKKQRIFSLTSYKFLQLKINFDWK